MPPYTMSCAGRSAHWGSRLFISMRSAASCCQPRQESSVPRGERITRVSSTVVPVVAGMAVSPNAVSYRRGGIGIMTKKQERAMDIAVLLKRMYPKAKCSLGFTNAFELLIATMLSAQSTDVRVNIVTKSLFRKYPGPQAFANASQVEMERDVKQTGFFRNKAKAVIAASKVIVEKHGGEVPRTMEDLTALPGVGRKTANVVLSNAFKTPVGIVVDTHVTRLSARLGLTSNIDAVKIE